MSIYKDEKSFFLNECLNSIFQQTLLPAEIVLVKDGPVGEDLENIIANYVSVNKVDFRIVALARNVGLGEALFIGLKSCSYEIVARMDADDICDKDRFKIQVNHIIANKSLAVVGSQIREFSSSIKDSKYSRHVPIEHDKIVAYSKYRNPLNHPSVIFRKSIILLAGSYKHMPFFEDYYLWLRVIKAGYFIENIDIELLFFRVSKSTFLRRHGTQYLKMEYKFYKTCYMEGLIGIQHLVINFCTRLPTRIIPVSIFKYIYMKSRKNLKN